MDHDRDRYEVYFGNIPFSSTETDLRSFIASSTNERILRVAIPKDRESGRPRGFAFVQVESPAAVDRLVEALNGGELGGRRIEVGAARKRSSSGDRDRGSDRRGPRERRGHRDDRDDGNFWE